MFINSVLLLTLSEAVSDVRLFTFEDLSVDEVTQHTSLRLLLVGR